MIAALKRQLKLRIATRMLAANREALRAGPDFRADRLTEAWWGGSVDDAGHLVVRGVDIAGLARRFGTPLHVVDTARLHEDYRRFLDAFSSGRARVRLGTSYKTNPVPFVLEKLHGWGSLAEVISHFELWLALRLGMPGERIIFNGPGKGRESLELAVESGVRLINVDSVEEMEELEAVCAARGRRHELGIRVTTEVGWSSQFGLRIRGGAALDAYARAARSPHLDPVGVHLHLGTGISDVTMYVRAISEVLRLARQVHRETGVPIRVLDLGGGFGVPTTRTKTEWDRRLQHFGLPIRTAEPRDAPTPADYAERIVPMIDAYFDDTGVDDPEVIFEPGRAITAASQMLLLSVLRVKTVGRETRDVILDGGRNLCAPLSWEFHEIHPVTRMREEALVAQNLYGPLCHPNDVIAIGKPLPALEAGDVVAVMDAGAYFVPNEMNFSNPRPGIVAIDGDTVRRVRRSESFDDIVGLDEGIGRSLDGLPG